MFPRGILLGFVAAAAAQSSDASDSMTSSVTDSTTMSTTATDSMSSSVTVDSSTSATTWSYFNTTVTSTVVVAELVTVCPSATTLNFNGIEYPATEGETITVNNCPCTVTTAIPTLTSTICGTGVTAPAQAAQTAPTEETAAAAVDNNAPAPAPGSASSTGGYVAPSAPPAGAVEVSGASSSSGSAKVVGMVGAALAGFLGLLVL